MCEEKKKQGWIARARAPSRNFKLSLTDVSTDSGVLSFLRLPGKAA